MTGLATASSAAQNPLEISAFSSLSWTTSDRFYPQRQSKAFVHWDWTFQQTSLMNHQVEITIFAQVCQRPPVVSVWGERTRQFLIRNKTHIISNQKNWFSWAKDSFAQLEGWVDKKNTSTDWYRGNPTSVDGWAPRFSWEKNSSVPKDCTLETSFSWPTSLHSTVALTCQSKTQLPVAGCVGYGKVFLKYEGHKAVTPLRKHRILYRGDRLGSIGPSGSRIRLQTPLGEKTYDIY